MVRVTKRRLKEDKLVSTTDKVSIFLSQYWKKLVSAAVAIVVVAGIIVLISYYITQSNEKAAKILTEARILFSEAEKAMEDKEKANTAKDKYEQAKVKFDDAAKNSKSRYMDSKAMFYSAKCSYYLGRYDEAINIFQKIARKYSRSVFATYAQEGIASSYQQLGGNDNLRKAIQQYDQLAKYPESFESVNAFLNKGRCYEKLGELNQAVAAYKNIIDKFKANVELALQDEAKTYVEKAKEVITKYQGNLSGLDAGGNTKDWFELLKTYDKTIYSQKAQWSQNKTSEELSLINEYETLSSDFIKSVNTGREYEKRGDWDNALRYYRRAVNMSFLPTADLFEEAKLRVDWIESAKGI